MFTSWLEPYKARGKETGSSDHLSPWLMPHKVSPIWLMAPEQMPDCLVLMCWGGNTDMQRHQTLGWREIFTLDFILNMAQNKNNNTLQYLFSAHNLFQTFSDWRVSPNSHFHLHLVRTLKDEAFKQKIQKRKRKKSLVLPGLTAATAGRSSFPSWSTQGKMIPAFQTEVPALFRKQINTSGVEFESLSPDGKTKTSSFIDEPTSETSRQCCGARGWKLPRTSQLASIVIPWVKTPFNNDKYHSYFSLSPMYITENTPWNIWSTIWHALIPKVASEVTPKPSHDITSVSTTNGPPALNAAT